MKLASGFMALLVFGSIAFANVAPVVSNVTAVQQPLPSQLVQISYDVSDADNDTMTVSLQISSDGGSTWTVPVNTVSGNIGDSVLSGVNYQIIWDAGADYPMQVGTQYQVKAIADDHQVLVGTVPVPAGPYSMGATYQDESQPIHTVNLPLFYMDIYEVTNTQYKAFCDATSRAYPPDPGFYVPDYFTNQAYSTYPVVNVEWYDAVAYATWAGKRLPTEAEWERAAKGSVDNRQWPWGDTWVAANANIEGNLADGYTYTSPAGNYPNGISPAGCYDMAGNVWEWCEDDYHLSYNGAPTDGSAWINDPRGSYRVIRGFSWNGPNTLARCACRYENNPADRDWAIGFRCASSQTAVGFGVSPLFSLDTRPINPPPCTNLAGSLVSSNVVLTWADPIQDTLSRPFTINFVEVWLGAVETGTLLATVNPGVQTLTHHKNENGCSYCVRALAGEYYGAAVCVETQELCDTTGLHRNMALECGTGYGIGQVGGSPPALAVDNSLSSAWYTESTTGRLVVALRTLCALDSLVLHVATYPDGSARHVVSISSDSSQWQTLLDTTAFWTDSQRLVIPASPLDTVKYISLYTPSSVSFVAWYEVEAYGRPLQCRAMLNVEPPAIGFGTINCDNPSVQYVQLVNLSAVPVPILNLINSDPHFVPEIALIGSWIAPYSSGSLTIQFQPLLEGAFQDTLYVVSRLFGPDTLRIPMSAAVLCQATLNTVPSSLDFGTIGCDSSAARYVQIDNTSEFPAPILGLYNSNADFHLDTSPIGSWIAPHSSAGLTVQVQPVSEGYLWDTLRIVSRLSGSDTLLIPITATVPVFPTVPESLVVRRGTGTHINLCWAPVTHSICENALTISQYKVFAASSPNGPFAQIGTSVTNSYVHPFVLNAHPIYFYRVTAWVDTPVPEGMVLVPAGPFTMGADYQPPTSLPVHTVNVPAFYIDVYEVTNAQYKAFCDATSRTYPDDAGFIGMLNYFTNPVYANYPVTMVYWEDAVSYATWAGKRLPTEAEWERAAKGTDNRLYPWGDTFVAANANLGLSNPDGFDYPSPVGSYPVGVSPAGCLDMAGNVAEWCEDDWHDDYTGAPTNGGPWIDDPRSWYRVFRGGSWALGYSWARCAFRSPTVAERFSHGGFRCAKTP
ncbi:SUMF1/EgtB/PvdO family nonheme iron enzyme [candidate division KSB1 bacterium]|nr:SUMF1/EgtB/PvdO family nonheme iron enzyme [candidate division KSB1 bacterium]